MKHYTVLLLIIGCCCYSPVCAREVLDFNGDWKFMRGDHPDAVYESCNDSSWESVRLPHDWSPDGPFDPRAFNGGSVACLPGGHGWYRKLFRIPEKYRGKNVILLFEGVSMDCEVWLNGRPAGKNFDGFTAFQVDLSGHLKVGREQNILAVSVNNPMESNWYTGSGICRDVKLIVLDPVQIPVRGNLVTTPFVTKDSALVQIVTSISNHSEILRKLRLKTRVLDAMGRELVEISNDFELEAGMTREINQQVMVYDPRLWSIESPGLYRIRSTLESAGRVLDESIESFCVRSIEFDTEKGILLNGQPVLLKVVSLQHTHGLLGAAAFRQAEIRKVQLMKAMGANAVRCAHYPPSKHFLDACDSTGMLVFDEQGLPGGESRVNRLADQIPGDFIMTGMDYLGNEGCEGENPDLTQYPAYLSTCGEIDICGYRKPRSYYHQQVWELSPTVYIAVRETGERQSEEHSWTWPEEIGVLDVRVYSGCDSVELYLNEISLGMKETGPSAESIASWEVPYVPGKLMAAGYVDGKPVDRQLLITAGSSLGIRLKAESKTLPADGNEIVYIRVEAVDREGRLNQLADQEIIFGIDGPAEIAAVGNASPYAPVDYPFKGNKCRFYKGRALLVIRSNGEKGEVLIHARAPGFKPGNLSLPAR